MNTLTRRSVGVAAGTLLLAGAFVAPAAAASSNSANNPGPYTSTGVSGPSNNGNGNGNATGRPAAGSVGNADNKNPKGQLPSAAADKNKGYECDGNSGIARGNPAHSGCNSEGGGEEN